MIEYNENLHIEVVINGVKIISHKINEKNLLYTLSFFRFLSEKEHI